MTNPRPDVGMVELARQGYLHEGREQVRKTEPKMEPMKFILDYIGRGSLNPAYKPFAANPLTKKERARLTPKFKEIYNDLDMLNKVLGRSTKAGIEALEAQARDWEEIAKHFEETQDTSRVLNYQGKRYQHPAKELDAARREDAKFEAAGLRMIKALNLVQERTPEVIMEAGERVETLRKILTIPQPYGEMQENLLPIELPVVEHLERLQHGAQDDRVQHQKILKEAGIDGGAILKESETHDPRSGRPYMDATDTMMAEAQEAQATKDRVAAGGKED